MKKTFKGKAIDGKEFTFDRFSNDSDWTLSSNQIERRSEINNQSNGEFKNGPYLKKNHLIYLFCILTHSRNFNKFWNIFRNNIKRIGPLKSQFEDILRPVASENARLNFTYPWLQFRFYILDD